MLDDAPRRVEVHGAESRVAVLDLLRSAGRPMTVVETAAALGLHVSTTRYHLAMLSSAGLVRRTVVRGTSRGRPPLRYEIRTADSSEPGAVTDAGSGAYEELAAVLARRLAETAEPVAAAREAGRRWRGPADLEHPKSARGLGPERALSYVADMMERLGFRPERPIGTDHIVLRACPFEAVARRQPAVVCGVHLGMLERTFEDLGSPGVCLEPFVTDAPLRCVVWPGGAGRVGTGDGVKDGLPGARDA
jgi:predicted ArsR family transcriptional regulator